MTLRIPMPLIVAALVAGGVAIPGAQPREGEDASRLMAALDARRAVYAEVAHRIWDFAELGYQERQSSALLQATLADAGFAVEAGVAGIPTAFVATWGSGRPVVAFVGEFDALPGLSQEAVPQRKAITANAPGHGCGHNLLGTASLAAAVATRDWLAARGGPGTIRYYGTPAEEGGSGKVYMVRAGLFKDVDAVLAWHPGDRNEANPSSTLANMSAKFRFHGVAAHAAASPEKGRSALDAVEAMDYMVNMMREHVPQETRIHYVITNGGGAPNVVPPYAEVYVYARHPDIRTLAGIWDRIVDAARGAALGTGTTMDFEVIGAVYNILPNEYLSSLEQRNLERVGGVTYTTDEQAFAEQLVATYPAPADLPLGSQQAIQAPHVTSGGASTDLGDVSWNVPTASLTAATFVPGTPGHSWQAVACGGMSIGIKGMMVAAKALALTGAELFAEPAHLAKARAEFERRRGDVVYAPRVGDRAPALDYRR